MGFNISGLAIDKNLENSISELETILGEKLVLDGEVNFEQASENWKEESYCDVYFTENSTLIFLSMDRGCFDFKVKNQKAFSFVLSEMTMTFAVNYTENRVLVRSFVETEDGEKQNEHGERLEFEETESDSSELIYHLIHETLDIPFWDIEPNEKCLRFNFSNEKPQATVPEPKIHTEENIKPETKKPWWKIW